MWTAGAAQERLVPALMRLYSATDHVIGLDVDRDMFDKFSVRHSIDLLLEQLWKDDVCRKSLTLTARQSMQLEGGGVFVEYIGSILNDLMYLLKDCFDRYCLGLTTYCLFSLQCGTDTPVDIVFYLVANPVDDGSCIVHCVRVLRK